MPLTIPLPKPLDYGIRAGVRPPDGYEAIKAFTGWRDDYLRADGTPMPMWEAGNIVRVALPRVLTYLTATGPVISRVAVHMKAAPDLQGALRAIAAANLWDKLGPFGGGYAFRTQRGSAAKLSMHAFGLALDFSPEANPLGMDPDQSTFGLTGEGREVVRLFEVFGWYWGGRFSRPDPMHFQFGTGW
jgi:hypothetical protein